MKNFNSNWDGIVRKNTQPNTQPIKEAHDNLTGYYDGARGGGSPPTKRSKTNSGFGVPSYKSTDFSAMNKKTADVLVKELNRIGKYLDPGYDMASDALEDIKKLVKTLKTVK